jgi:hypothetical protein
MNETRHDPERVSQFTLLVILALVTAVALCLDGLFPS